MGCTGSRIQLAHVVISMVSVAWVIVIFSRADCQVVECRNLVLDVGRGFLNSYSSGRYMFVNLFCGLELLRQSELQFARCKWRKGSGRRVEQKRINCQWKSRRRVGLPRVASWYRVVCFVPRRTPLNVA
eukprot:3877201-Pyramimonas_sp.AAC.1